MKFRIFKSRRNRLKMRLEEIGLDVEKIELILREVDEYEKSNLASIAKLKRDRSITVNKINGALKQAINAHGPITKVLIGSATKRIMGATMNNDVKITWFKRIKNFLVNDCKKKVS